MFFQEDDTYNDIRDKSLNQWLDEMEHHEDIAVRGGVKLTREYVEYLKDEIQRLKDENELKNSYLKKLAKK
jgi:polyhydroxyalkanoate synthesis regulator phasin